MLEEPAAFAGMPWEEQINARTRSALALENVSFDNKLNLVAFHWDNRVATVNLRGLLKGKPSLSLRDGSDSLVYDSIDSLIEAGWAVNGPSIRRWRGEAYGSHSNAFGGLKVLVLGESTHDSQWSVGEAPDYLTNLTISLFLEGETYAFHRALTTVLSNKMNSSEVSREDRSVVWNSIAFSNVIPVVAASESGAAPSTSSFHLTSPFLNQLFDELKPEVVMVFSLTAWKWL